jgi:DNA-binding CsgD family transcriptional regulator
MKVLPYVVPVEEVPVAWDRQGAPSTPMHAPRRPRLTNREQTIVDRLLDGCSNRMIARQLGMSEQSVKNRLTMVYRKFGVSTRLQLLLSLRRS